MTELYAHTIADYPLHPTPHSIELPLQTPLENRAHFNRIFALFYLKVLKSEYNSSDQLDPQQEITYWQIIIFASRAKIKISQRHQKIPIPNRTVQVSEGFKGCFFSVKIPKKKGLISMQNI